MPSDPYLMRGYDEKAVTLPHTSAKTITITLEVNIDGKDRWVKYKSIQRSVHPTARSGFVRGFVVVLDRLFRAAFRRPRPYCSAPVR